MVAAIRDSAPDCNYNLQHIKGNYSFVRPFRYAEPECESPDYSSLKMSILDYLATEKSTGMVADASVYLHVFSNSGWMAVNDGAGYQLGSLFKVVNLITVLRMAESDRTLLDDEVLFEVKPQHVPHQTYTTKTIELGKKYKVKELLNYMIAYSDNYATDLLHSKMDIDVFKRVFFDFDSAL